MGRPLRSRLAGSVRPVAVGLLALGLAPASAGAAPVPPPQDPFYAAPPSLAAAAPGTILRSRQVDVNLGPVPITGAAYSAYQLLYRTNDATDQPVANVTTIIVPNGAAPAGGRQLLSVNDAEDSVDPTCAPSYQLQTGEQQNGNLAAETSLAANQLALGRDLVIPDAEGPKSEYIVTGMEGHATLDSIRAVERFAPAQLNGDATPVGLIGYSGGGHVTAAANELAPAYAPELNIVGVAGGGVPVGNRETFAYLDGSVGTGVLMATSIALDFAFPQMNLYAYLNAKGKAFAQQVSSGCASSVFAAPFAHYDDWTTVPDAVDLPAVAQVIRTNSLGHAAPTAPTFYYNAIHDELITIQALDKLVAYYCAHGSRIDYFRDPAGFEHIQGVSDFFPLALNYLTGRFNGDAVATTCDPANASPQAGAPKAGGAGSTGTGERARRAQCLSGRVIRLHPRVPAGVRVRRMLVFVNGKLIARTGRRASLRISLRGRPRGAVTVDVLIVGRSHGHDARADDRRVLHTCRRATKRRRSSAAQAPPAHAARQPETTVLISRALGGGLPNAASTNAVISGDERRARVIAYQSAATNIVREQTGDWLNVFVVHRAGRIDNLGPPWEIGSTALVSRGLNGQPPNGNSFAPSVDGTIRADPSCVAFLSAATNLTPGGGSGRVAAYVSRGLPGPIAKISQGAAGVDEVKVSSNCSRIAYSAAGALFVWAPHHRVHRVPAPGAVTGFSFAVGYTQDLVFASRGGIYLSAGATGRPKLVARGDANPVYSDVQRHVVAYEKGQGISWRDLGHPEHRIGLHLARKPVISNSGFYILFQAGEPSHPGAYLRTDVAKTILPVSLDAGGDPLPGGGANPDMNYTANYVLFDSPAPLGAASGVHEVYMRYRGGI